MAAFSLLEPSYKFAFLSASASLQLLIYLVSFHGLLLPDRPEEEPIVTGLLISCIVTAVVTFFLFILPVATEEREDNFITGLASFFSLCAGIFKSQ